ncbi:MAG: hypothetical protein IKM97_00540 [Clostridia bacterium]|nr:hypothetical protein [Clostridia bacterium]
MEVKGQIEEIIYQNEANGYTIAVFTTEEEKVITIVRIFAFYYMWRLPKISRKNGSTSGIWRAI